VRVAAHQDVRPWLRQSSKRRQVGQRPSDKKTKKVLALHKEGLSYRLIGRNVGLSKNTIMDIVKRAGA
jgi:DNA-binding NarL/FixJ family response regulator